MTTLITHTFITLENLFRSCERSYLNFVCASEAIHDLEIKETLLLYAAQRRRFAEELKPHLALLSEEFLESESTEENGCPVHDCEGAILRWSIAQDGLALQIYKRALAMFLPVDTQFLIAAQYTMMCRAHERMQFCVSRAAMGVLVRPTANFALET